MATVLALYYSLTHQTEQVMLEVAGALTAAGHDVTLEAVKPVPPFPLPVPLETLTGLLRQVLKGQWPVVGLEPLKAGSSRAWDLVLIGYQPWYMTPSVPIHSLLKGPEGKVLRGRPVIGLMTSRAMYSRASRLFRDGVEACGGSVLEQRVFIDQDHKSTNFVSLLHYLKHGHDPEAGPLLKLIKPFGIGTRGRDQARAYGIALADRLKLGAPRGDGKVEVLK